MTSDTEPADVDGGLTSADDGRRLTAIMFTDVVGFTTMAQKDESVAMKVLEESNEAVRSVLRTHGGREVKTMGDAFLIEFPSALAAVRCAVEIQLKAREWKGRESGAGVPKLRIGIHIGDVIDREGDIFGDAVNVSSRVEPLAEPGGVCISGQAYDQVRNKAGLQFVKLGQRALELDPLSLVINVNWGDHYYYLDEPDKAIEHFLKVIEMNPIFPVVYPSLAQAYMRKSMFDEALAAVAKYEELTKDKLASKLMRAYLCAYMGRAEEARRLLGDVERDYENYSGVAYNIGVVYIILGDKDKGFEWLETSFKSYDGALYSMAVDYEFDDVRSDLRYVSLMKRLGLTL